jgi:single-stranded DNA-binding protein
MGFLRTNYEDVNAGFDPLPIGDYECIVSKVEVTKSGTSGAPMLKVTLTVRDDVEQQGRKRKFFDNMVEMDNMMWKFQQVAKAAQLPAGEDYPTIAEFAAAIQYKPVLIKNKHEEYNGEKQDKIAYWKESKVGGGTEAGGAGDPFANNGTPIDISDDDLPF